MMVLLSVLALGLLGLSSVALRSSTHEDAHAKARANARLALMMAIGELQREMGPDSRISAPYDAGTTPDGGQPRWTAVYDAWKTPDDPSTAESPASRRLVFRRWLVSGANQASGGPAGNGDTALLVGPGSLGTSAPASDQIRAPMLACAGNGNGCIAWWTSDESVKAKVNAGPDADLLPNPLTDAQSPPHINHRSIPALNALEWKPGQRSITVSTASVNLAAPLENGGVGSLNHDITVHSAGVLADVRAGRLKRDLSNLLARPVDELENKPLYLANGRMNRFDISDDGTISNAPFIPATSGYGSNRWGINLEELHLFHQIHREVDWSGGSPKLVSKNSLAEIGYDRFKIYRHPLLEACHFIYSLRAVPDGGSFSGNPTYRMQMYQDAMVCYSNPNDIAIEWPAGLRIIQQVHSLPYKIRWNIRRSGALVNSNTCPAQNSVIFESRVDEGFKLEPGEAGVFGIPTSDSNRPVLQRGFAPKGQSLVLNLKTGTYSAWDLRATGLRATDDVNFTLRKITSTDTGSSGLLLSRMFIGAANTSDLGTFTLNGPSLDTASINPYLLPNITPHQVVKVQEYVNRPMPVIMISYLNNVEKNLSSGATQAREAFPSRPFHMLEPAISERRVSTANFDTDIQSRQWLFTAERMNFEFGNDRTLPAGAGGRNVYHGGARQVSDGSFQVIKRRIPLSPPLSLGSFENAIACGLTVRVAGGTALSGKEAAVGVIGALAKSIGNSWATPFLASNQVSSGNVSDPSWMANTALWDSWFLSGVVDGRGTGSSTWMNDPRSPQQQFYDFAQGSAPLRNKRFLYYAHKPLDLALEELFTAEDFKPAAVNKLTKYLLVDGAFNVNSTSSNAWTAFLSSVREQEILESTGATQKKTHPFGTLGYAATQATSGREGDWNGFRDLTDAEIKSLADAIVAEVKARGPFLSLADFVNRSPNSPNPEHRAIGAVQAAIDKSGLNDHYKANGRTLSADDISVLAGKDTLAAEPIPARAIGSAGYLSQAALLTAFGSQIAVRGDTFIIRTYGDHRDDSGKILSRAWCEALVQRLPDYLDATDEPDAATVTSAVNGTFGRKFKIASFRWLKPDEV